MKSKILAPVWLMVIGVACLVQPGFTQARSSTPAIDSTPPKAPFVAGGGQPITLEGDTVVSGHLATSGLVETDLGVRFADGSVQSAANLDGSATANQGFYSNSIAAFSPPFAYTEICFKNVGIQFDIHSISEPTAGGDCLPGDTGFVIEKKERGEHVTLSWTQARANCLMDDMRLLEPFEWQIACANAGTFQLDELTDVRGEWVSNTATIVPSEGNTALIAPVSGRFTCVSFTPGTIANTSHNQSMYEWRCGR